MEALDRPALMGQAQLLGQRAVIQRPGEVPLGLAVLAGQGPLAEQPAEGTRQAKRWAPRCCGSSTVTLVHRVAATALVSPWLVCRGAICTGWGWMRGRPVRACGSAETVPSRRLRPGWRVGGSGWRAAIRTSAGRRAPKTLLTWTTYGSWRASKPARNSGTSP